MLQRFTDFITSHKLFGKEDRLLLAVSGGVDSVVLTDLCFKAGYRFAIAHCNFQLRGEESERDELFVRELAKRYDVPINVKRFETAAYADRENCSIQEAARLLRYEWFEELVNETLLSEQPQQFRHPDTVHVLTAHHADDSVETMVMHFFRGTGLLGLTGIPVAYGHVKRPLLCFTRKEIESYAAEQGLPFVEDSSNLTTKYTRNFFRHDILPAIEKVYPQVRENLYDNLRRFQSIDALYREATQQLIQKLVRRKGNELHIPVKQLLQYKNRSLLFEIIRPYGFTEKQLPDVWQLTEGESGRYVVSAHMYYRIIRYRHWLILAPEAGEEATLVSIEPTDQLIDYGGGTLRLQQMERTGSSIPSDLQTAWLDAEAIIFPLLLRRWKEGDYFYPLGMRKKKKVARFLIDQKLSRTQKEQVWVLESNKRILWVVGQRIDDRFKITSSTSRVLEIKTGVH
jgi:tRNA(Ile)-lysidine synthase